MTPKALPHRLRNGQCRECGKYDLSSAPRTCVRCALEVMSGIRYEVVDAPNRLFEVRGWELWRTAAADMASGRLRADRFHLYVGHNDGAPLERPEGLPPGLDSALTYSAAQALAADLQQRYPQVWVVTTLGSWNTIRA